MSAPFIVGQTVEVFKYGSWYRGVVQTVGRTRMTVLFYTKAGRAKTQPFNMFDRYSVRFV